MTRRRIRFLQLQLAGAVALSSCSSFAHAPPQRNNVSATVQRTFPATRAGTRVLAWGTYSILDVGKVGVPKLTAPQLAWIDRVKSSHRYSKIANDLRFIITPSSTPLTIYDRCGGGWGEPRDLCKPTRGIVPRAANETLWGSTYHVIGGGCSELLILAGPEAPKVFTGRDPTCDLVAPRPEILNS